MQDSNQKTLQVYQENFDRYVAGTVSEVTDFMSDWIDRIFNGLPLDTKVLEIGSATGRDAAYIEKKGFVVDRSDAVHSSIKYLKKQGYDARYLDILKDAPANKYHVIFANAVLLHFTVDELHIVLRNIYSSLHKNGQLVFTVKEGEGEIWSDHKMNDKRYFCLWKQDELNEILISEGFTIMSNEIDPHKKWLHVVCEVSYGN